MELDERNSGGRRSGVHDAAYGRRRRGRQRRAARGALSRRQLNDDGRRSDRCDVRDYLTFEEGGYIGRPTHEEMALAMNLTYPSEDVSSCHRIRSFVGHSRRVCIFVFVGFKPTSRVRRSPFENSPPIVTSAASPSKRPRPVARLRVMINRHLRARPASSATGTPAAITG